MQHCKYAPWAPPKGFSGQRCGGAFVVVPARQCLLWAGWRHNRHSPLRCTAQAFDFPKGECDFRGRACYQCPDAYNRLRCLCPADSPVSKRVRNHRHPLRCVSQAGAQSPEKGGPLRRVRAGQFPDTLKSPVVSGALCEKPAWRLGV